MHALVSTVFSSRSKSVSLRRISTGFFHLANTSSSLFSQLSGYSVERRRFFSGEAERKGTAAAAVTASFK